MDSHKVHFFDENDPVCVFKSTIFTDVKLRKTYCGRDANWVIRHTEEWSQVTCLNCLLAVNKIDRRKHAEC